MISRLDLSSKFPWLPFTVPIGAMLAALGIQEWLFSFVVNRPLLLLYPALAIGCFFGNRISIMVSALIGAIGSWLLFMPSSEGISNLASTSIFVFTGVCLGFLRENALREARKLSAAKLVETNARLDQIFNEIPSTLSVMMGPDLVYTRVNKRFFEFTGYDRDVIGKPLREVYKGFDAENTIENFDRVYRKGEGVQGKELFITLPSPDGRKREHFLDFSIQPLKNAHGKIEGVLSQTIDVTDRVKARKIFEEHAIHAERARHSIANERENFRNLFQQTPEMVCILSGPEHRFEFVNDSHVKALGFDATGKTVREAQPESVEVHGILDEVFRSGKTAELFEIPVTLTDRLRFFNLTYAARRDDDGCINGVMILGMEVTEQVATRRQLLESQERYQLLFDCSPLPKIIFDVETLQIIDVNQTALRHYGYTRSEFLHRTKADLRPPGDREKLKESVVRNAETKVELMTGLHHIKKDGTIITVEISSLDLILDGRRARLSAVVDVTEKVQAIEEQKRLVANLQETKSEAERANHLKTAFLANMSHEIRTPLGAILGFTDLLRDPSLSREEHANYINIITRNGEQLAAIINDILDLSKVEAGHLTLDYGDTNPEEVMADIVSLLRVKASERDLVLDFRADESTPPTIFTDDLRLRQILMNLVGNAIKFTQVGSVKVRSYLDVDATGNRFFCYEVSDTGIGIPLSQQEKIFDAFVQADGTLSRKFGGTGLGLALSRQLARNLGGDVKVLKSTEDKGTTFQIRVLDRTDLKSSIPVSRGADSVKKEIPIDALEKLHLLVVDDSPDNRQLMWHILSKYGAAVDFAENGVMGYRKALVGNFDLVLMDIQMPEMDGYTATQKLRDAGYQRPIIALTAHAMDEIREKCLSVGCTDHLTKPIKPKLLVETVAKYTL